MSLEPRGTAFLMEITALTNHREAVREALVEISSEFHAMQVAGFAELFDRLGVDTDRFPPELAVIAVGGISRMVVRERALGRPWDTTSPCKPSTTSSAPYPPYPPAST